MNKNSFLVEVIWEYASEHDCVLVADDRKTRMMVEDEDMMHSLLEGYDFNSNVQDVHFKNNHGSVEMEILTNWSAEELDEIIPEW